MTEREALKLTLEALEFVNKSDDDCDFMNSECAAKVEDAITAIKEALAQPEQIPPSVHSNTHQPEQEQIQPDKVCIEDDGCPTEKAVLQRFWREHQKTQPEQEPVAWANRVIGGRKWLSIHASKGASDKWLEYRIKEQAQGEEYEQVALYTTPSQRTDKEQQIETLKRCLFQMQEAAKDLVEQAKSLTPPQRTWVGLLDSQKLAIIRDCSHLSMAQLIELVEEEIRRNNNA